MARKNNIEDETIDFNDKKAVQNIVSELAKGKIKNAKNINEITKKVIGFLTSNIKPVAITASYFILSGISVNIYGIYKLVKFILTLL